VLLVLGGLGAGVLVGEIAARLLFAAPVATSPSPSATPDSSLPVLETVFELGTPGVRGIYKGAYYRANSAGFRGPEYDREPAKGVFRIAAVGDSFVMGEGVLEEEAYPMVLQDLLNADASERTYEVLNFGISGANIHHMVDRLEGLALSFHPDLVVYGLTSNDIEVEGYEVLHTTEAIVNQRKRFKRFENSPSYLLRLLWPRWVSFETGFSPPEGTYMYEVFENYLHNPVAWRHFVSGLDRLATIQKKQSVDVVVFVHPILAYLWRFHPFREVYARVERAAEMRGLKVVQGLPGVIGIDAEELWISRDNPHPNPRAHRLFAETLAEGLRREQVLR
jgi:lysophospholipase L1-like esterase